MERDLVRYENYDAWMALERKEPIIHIKRLSLIGPERASEFGLEEASDPFFVSEWPEDPSSEWEGGRRLIYEVGNIVQSQHIDNVYGGIDFEESKEHRLDKEIREINHYNRGAWIAMVQPQGKINNVVHAEAVKIDNIRAYCWFKWSYNPDDPPPVENHYKELQRGLLVYDSNFKELFPICDQEDHPVAWGINWRSYGHYDIVKRFSISGGRLQLSPIEDRDKKFSGVERPGEEEKARIRREFWRKISEF